VDLGTIDALSAIFGLYITVAVLYFVIYGCNTCVVIAKVWAGTEVAVERLHIVTLFVLCIEWTEVRLFFAHIFKVKVVDDVIFTHTVLQEFLNNFFMLLCVGIDPLLVRHGDSFFEVVSRKPEAIC